MLHMTPSHFYHAVDMSSAMEIVHLNPVVVGHWHTRTSWAILHISDAATGAVMLNGRSRIFQTQKSAVSILAYMRYKTYATYDHPACVAFCLFLVACKSFNIFHERDQSLSPESGCMDRASTVPIKCSFWGAATPTTTLTNKGQYRSKFHFLMAGCNGYSIRPIVLRNK